MAAVADATIARDLGVCADTGHRPIKRWCSARIMARPPTTTRRNASPLITLARYVGIGAGLPAAVAGS